MVIGRFQGGTVEPKEFYLDTIKRELIEETGGRLIEFTPFGYWNCFSSQAAPYRPHISHPNYIRLIGYGEIEIFDIPTIGDGQELISNVKIIPIKSAISRFIKNNKPEIADLYRLANFLNNR
jgi:8-oxo-dGTP diphosphatase